MDPVPVLADTPISEVATPSSDKAAPTTTPADAHAALPSRERQWRQLADGSWHLFVADAPESKEEAKHADSGAESGPCVTIHDLRSGVSFTSVLLWSCVCARAFTTP